MLLRDVAVKVVNKDARLGSSGSQNLLHEARWYGDDDVPLGQVFAALAVPAFLLLSR